jgi:hypothetical protein
MMAARIQVPTHGHPGSTNGTDNPILHDEYRCVHKEKCVFSALE